MPREGVLWGILEGAVDVFIVYFHCYSQGIVYRKKGGRALSKITLSDIDNPVVTL